LYLTEKPPQTILAGFYFCNKYPELYINPPSYFQY
jgi:hypothetical protein